jgi:hypothetical protein
MAAHPLSDRYWGTADIAMAGENRSEGPKQTPNPKSSIDFD